MVIVVFRARMRPGAEPEAEAIGTQMYALASAMPGFVSYHEYAAADGESVSIVQFESHEMLAAWRNHPEHVAAQRAGRDRIFSEYRISVCDVVRESSFPR